MYSTSHIRYVELKAVLVSLEGVDTTLNPSFLMNGGIAEWVTVIFASKVLETVKREFVKFARIRNGEG